MDPNVNLVQLRAAIAIALGGQGDTIEEDRAAYDAAELAQSLDDWVSSGGFLPSAWRPRPKASLLTPEEFDRLLYLLGLLNDLSVTQVDHDETADLDRLVYKIRHDGEEP